MIGLLHSDRVVTNAPTLTHENDKGGRLALL
jgi:hypothetical protein